MNQNRRIETREEILAYLQNLKYALEHGARISFQKDRRVDNERERHYTNEYTVRMLFPDENPIDTLRRELRVLTVEEYIGTVKDLRFPNRSEMREFGKTFPGAGDVYIKIRVELFSENGDHLAFIMSFHFAENEFGPEMFPYR